MGFNKKIEDGNNLSEMKTDLAYRSLLIVIVSSNCDILKKDARRVEKKVDTSFYQFLLIMRIRKQPSIK